MNGCEGRERLGANYNQRSVVSNLLTAAPYSFSSIIFRIALLTGAVSLSLKGNSRYL